MISAIVEEFSGKWNCKSFDGTHQGCVTWKAGASGTATGGPGTASEDGDSFAIASRNPVKHEWCRENGQHGQLNLIRLQGDTCFGQGAPDRGARSNWPGELISSRFLRESIPWLINEDSVRHAWACMAMGFRAQR